ncbi:MAG: nucleoside triphosphate pyrophosphohydrolase [Candidatus Cloacimonetes bacterium]|nr:nucleoside triphosphate pyrophosphohydrolase [Candidatus Cloacimonadota bacterium]
MSSINELEKIVERLRDPKDGCPWDRKQTSASLIPNFIEEVYEAVEAIENNDYPHLCEELGDILLHIMLQVKIAEEAKHFNLEEVIKAINSKLIRRHPHVFDNEFKNDTIQSEQVKINWEKIKLEEKKHSRKSVLEGVPKNLPALIQAQRIQEKAASTGFDWKTKTDSLTDISTPIFDKIYEEINELKDEIEQNHQTKIEDELGDLLFSVVNLSRKLKIDAESSLRKSTEKFKNRFKKVEQICQKNNINISDTDMDTLDDIWETIKKD